MGSVYTRQEVETSIQKMEARGETKFLLWKEPLTIVYKGSSTHWVLWRKKAELDAKYGEEEQAILRTHNQLTLALLEQTTLAKQALQDKKDAELLEAMKQVVR